MLEQIMTVGFVTAFLTASVRMAVPLIYAGLGETISEKAGILNIGMEGVMLGGAFFSFAGTFYSGSLAVGLLCGMAGGAMVSAIHGLLSIRLAQDQSVSGKIMPVRVITRKAVPQFLTSSGTVNVSLSTKIADVAMIKEMQMATTEDIIIPK